MHRQAIPSRAIGALAALGIALPVFGFPPTAASGAQPAEEAAARSLIERIEAYHGSLPHFEARFEQRFSPRIFGRDRIESGRLTVKQPGKMRWDYEAPEPKVFVSDGTTTWFHVPADRQVVVGSFAESLSATDEAGRGGGVNPLDFLTGGAAILDHFDALITGEADGELREVSLVPRETGGELQSLRLAVDARTGRIEAIESEDPEGNRTAFGFSEFRSGPPPPDSLFVFTIPPGTEVVAASEFRE